MKKISILLLAVSFAYACSSDDDNNNNGSNIDVTKAEVVSNYADIVYQSYLDSYNSAVTMQTAINEFVANPTEAGLTAAKNSWLAAREFYGQTEAYRETNGPIDTDSDSWSLGTEGQMNAWPIDESYIDYVAVGTEAYAGDYGSIISDTDVSINEAIIAGLNEGVDDKSISTGWHAIEFLLWGQDNTSPSEDLAGQRAYTDYTTADNAERRGLYLTVSTDLLVGNLLDLVNTWAVGGSYRTVFESLDTDTALKQAINGAFFIAGDELSSERMIAPVDSTDGINGLGQEDEHSCFSDNTNRDVFANAQGVINVIYGSYGSIEGASFYDLVNQADTTQALALQAAATDAMTKVNIVGNNAQPFDYLITLESSDDLSGPVMQAVDALFTLADEISASASVIGINLN
ncbi:imelysin family protein [Winogradskyella undariae]|uniref:imelysin family protein n=1 Tax=Winogradskyella undariae TaxID=1285465 RepID=UPI0015C7B863|nr:imelysin family protein [Winogradskyella undariae]